MVLFSRKQGHLLLSKIKKQLKRTLPEDFKTILKLTLTYIITWTDVGFVWHPDTLFQSNYISVGTPLSLVENTKAHSFSRPYTGNQCPLAIMYNLLIFLLS